MEEGETKITWIRCPECGAKIGIIISVGKGPVEEKPTAVREAVPPTPAPAPSIKERLAAAGVDVSLLEITEGEEVTVIRPKRFLGDLWGPINDAVKSLGGVWVREGRESRWEIKKGS
ncbi:hypothetical protein CW700_00440 [Candidatus Bathyarchaeota archaeon]|nr:MAG: hypothetical protein CW700_00440 [Candidatus Bathyarchaeota archaeon]